MISVEFTEAQLAALAYRTSYVYNTLTPDEQIFVNRAADAEAWYEAMARISHAVRRSWIEATKTKDRLSDQELADVCERNGYPSVGDRLRGGDSQEEATVYLVGACPTFDDGEARWLVGYLARLHGPAVYRFSYEVRR